MRKPLPRVLLTLSGGLVETAEWYFKEAVNSVVYQTGFRCLQRSEAGSQLHIVLSTAEFVLK